MFCLQSCAKFVDNSSYISLNFWYLSITDIAIQSCRGTFRYTTYKNITSYISNVVKWEVSSRSYLAMKIPRRSKAQLALSSDNDLDTWINQSDENREGGRDAGAQRFLYAPRDYSYWWAGSEQWWQLLIGWSLSCVMGRSSPEMARLKAII